ncbi:uncharacterized protein G2W53_008934 [Senna tora]|uniref:Uncharacterized protein n=1 Tax=Senna tora TaxID=362788 RepID=A0A835C997_9FABA|nr:uncharacterized protein G2W53_008934 [Senna tora]
MRTRRRRDANKTIGGGEKTEGGVQRRREEGRRDSSMVEGKGLEETAQGGKGSFHEIQAGIISSEVMKFASNRGFHGDDTSKKANYNKFMHNLSFAPTLKRKREKIINIAKKRIKIAQNLPNYDEAKGKNNISDCD